MDNTGFIEAVESLKSQILNSALSESDCTPLVRLVNEIGFFGSTAYERGYKNGMKYSKRNIPACLNNTLTPTRGKLNEGTIH